MNILLAGIVGSRAYGLANPDSDTDRLGVYAAPTVEFHGLYPPIGKSGTIVRHEPSDVTYHEAGRLAELCLSGNPAVNELLWLDSYEIQTDLGNALVEIRSAFLSRQRVRDAYFGYAVAQFKRLTDTGQFASKQRSKPAKHARHMLRLLDQGYELYSTGRLTMRLANPDWYIKQGELIAMAPDNAEAHLARATEQFDTATSPLPEHADIDTIQAWLHMVRARYYTAPGRMSV
jgi:predicted nucleotidyltransferase